jgi:YfiH family protein
VNTPLPDLIHPFPEWSHRVRAAFSTRQGGVSQGTYASLNLGFRSGDDRGAVERNWELAIAAAGMPPGPVILPRMTHGDRMVAAPVAAPQAEGLIEPEGADAVFARAPGGILAVTMADCLTALIFDPSRGTIAAVHAGWRGTRAGILRKSLDALIESGALDPKSALVAFGPCLRRESLEVGPEVASQLDPRFVSRARGKIFFDMPADNLDQALSRGIPRENIRDGDYCTMSEPRRYFSYRRDGPASGRMAAFISLL